MIQVSFQITEMDYDSLVEAFLPAMAEKLTESGNPLGALFANGMPTSVAKGLLARLSQEKRDELAAGLINSNGDKFCALLQEALGKKDIHVRLADLRAEARP